MIHLPACTELENHLLKERSQTQWATCFMIFMDNPEYGNVQKLMYLSNSPQHPWAEGDEITGNRWRHCFVFVFVFVFSCMIFLSCMYLYALPGFCRMQQKVLNILEFQKGCTPPWGFCEPKAGTQLEQKVFELPGYLSSPWENVTFSMLKACWYRERCWVQCSEDGKDAEFSAVRVGEMLSAV